MAELCWCKLLQAKRFREKETVQRMASDTRSPFKKDFDTVCNSTILRRLQDKAQVFPLEQEDYARTRLTHSIETMSIAESLGVQAVGIINKEKKYLGGDNAEKVKAMELVKDIPTILKTAALLHDMGNPPFGHLGEKIIGDWFKDNLGNLSFNSKKQLVFNSTGEAKATLEYMFKGQYAEDFKHFEGNAQLFRLVTRLSLVVDENGMNLTFPVMASFIKYPTPSHKISEESLTTKKMGYFCSEQGLYKKIDDTLGLNSCRHPLAFLLEAADDIAYLTADIEDAHRKGLISLRKIKDYLNEEKGDGIVESVLTAIDSYVAKANEMGYEDVEDYVVHRLRVLIKGLMIDSMYDAFKAAYDCIMTGQFNEELINVSSAKCIASVLRKIEKENIYYCSSILENKTRAIAVITKLLETYVPAIVNWNEKEDANTDSSNNLLYLSLSSNYRHICRMANEKITRKSNKTDKDFETMVYNKILLVTDQISGMTDTHALTIFNMLTAN